MRRIAHLLVGAAGAVWLPGQAFADDAAQKLAREVAQRLAQIAQDGARIVRDEALVKQFEQQLAPQFRQLYKTELHFMRLVCQPTKQQYDKIAADGEPALSATIKKFAVNMQGGRSEQFDPHTLINDALAKSVRTTLSAEQAARYQKELDQRAAARKRAALLNLVANVDKVLVLTTEQRAKLGAILENKWNDSWNQTQMLMYGGQYFPQMPDTEILPILTDTQKTVWRGISKGNVRFGFNLGIMQGIEMWEELWWDEDLPQDNPERADGKAAVKGNGTTKPVEKK